MKEHFELKISFEVAPSRLYQAWLDSKSHSEMTGGEAVCSDQVGDSFTAWDGYIWGKNLELLENEKIVQSWRTSEFSEQDEDSMLTVELIKIPEGTKLILRHTNIPTGQTQYESGWQHHYFTPMKEFFSKK